MTAGVASGLEPPVVQQAPEHFCRVRTDGFLVGFGPPARRSRTLPPSRIWQGTPSALALVLRRAFSMAPSPSTTTPPAAGRVKQ